MLPPPLRLLPHLHHDLHGWILVADRSFSERFRQIHVLCIRMQVTAGSGKQILGCFLTQAFLPAARALRAPELQRFTRVRLMKRLGGALGVGVEGT